MAREIVLSVKRDLWRAVDDMAESVEKDFAIPRRKTLERDQNVCQFCGFTSAKYQDVHHVNDNHRDHDLNNLATACKLCHGCHHIGLAGQNDGAFLVYLPEISQAVLNRFLRAAYIVSRGAKTSRAEKLEAQQLLTMLEARRKPVKEQWGTDLATDFATEMLRLPQDVYDRRDMALLPLRLVIRPTSRMLGTAVLDYWATEVHTNVPPTLWDTVCNNIYEAV